MRVLQRFIPIVIACAFAMPASAAVAVPAPDGHLVRDLTGTVDAALLDQLNERALALEKDTSIEFVALMVPSLGGVSIEEYSLAVMNGWGVGKKGKDNGVVYVWCPAEKRQRIQVGYGLEPYLTDIVAGRIIDEVKARVPKEPHGPRLAAMVDAIIERLRAASRGEAVPELTPSAPKKDPFYKKTWFILTCIVLAIILLLILLAVSDEGGSSGGYGGGYGGSSGGGSWSGGGGGGGFSFGGGGGGGGGASGSD